MLLVAPSLVDRPRKPRRRPVEEAPRLELPLQRPGVERELLPSDEADRDDGGERGIALVDFYI